jgi:hypothetical protein
LHPVQLAAALDDEIGIGKEQGCLVFVFQALQQILHQALKGGLRHIEAGNENGFCWLHVLLSFRSKGGSIGPHGQIAKPQSRLSLAPDAKKGATAGETGAQHLRPFLSMLCCKDSLAAASLFVHYLT